MYRWQTLLQATSEGQGWTTVDSESRARELCCPESEHQETCHKRFWDLYELKRNLESIPKFIFRSEAQKNPLK